MPDQSTVDRAIATRITEIQAVADREKHAHEAIETAKETIRDSLSDAADWDDLPDDASVEVIAALLAHQQTDPNARAHLNEGVWKGLQNKIRDLQADGDQETLMEIQEEVLGLLQPFMSPPGIEPGMPLIEPILIEPTAGSDEWTAVVTVFQMDENYQVKEADTLDIDLYIALHVTSADAKLSEEFNARMKHFAAGQKIEPFTMTFPADSAADAGKRLHLKGHVEKDGQILSPLFASLPLIEDRPKGGLAPDGPATYDLG